MTDTPDTNQKNPSHNDPMLTAFALGELLPGSDVYEQVQARLETDTDARAYVNETRAMGEQLSSAYKTDPNAAGLSEHQQKELAAMIDQQDNAQTEPIKPPMRTWLSRPALIAAGLALAAGAAITTIAIINAPNTPATQHADSDNITGLSQIHESLAEPVAVDFEDASLSEVFAFLNKQTRVKIDTDWDALGKRGINAQTAVTLKADELIPAGRVLSAALQAAWSQSQHPDPAQWTMTDTGITVAPQSALLQARLDATAALLENRLSPSPLDKRVLSVDRAEVWESDLWNQVLAQRSKAADAVLAEADVAFDAAEAATGEEDFDLAANKVMYAYHLLRANSPLLASDQFDEPTERFAKINQAIAEYHQKEQQAALDKAIEMAKAEHATLDEKTAQARANTASEKFKQADQAQRNGQLNNAVQLYEDAVLLDPTNETYMAKLTEAQATLKTQLGSLGVLDQTALDRSLDYRSIELERSVNALGEKLELETSYAAPLALGSTQGQGGLFGDGYGGQAMQQQQLRLTGMVAPQNNSGSLYPSDGKKGNFRYNSPAAPMATTPAPASTSAPVVIAGKDTNHYFSIDGLSGEANRKKQAESLAKMTDDLSELKRGIRHSRDDYDRYQQQSQSYFRINTNENGELITRRAALQTQRDALVKGKTLDQLDGKTKEQFEAITIALDDAKRFEPFELKRLEAIQDLEELRQQFLDGCRDALIDDPELSRDAFAMVNDNPFYNPGDAGRAMSTFSVDVDTAAYTIARRQLMERGQLPVPGAIRIEEMINYFDYNYDAPVVDRGALEDGVVTQASLEAYEKKHEGFAPFATHLQVTDCPWTQGHQLVRIGIKGMEVAQEDRPSAHLTFLLDVSGSMNRPNKLGLVKESLKLLLNKLNDKDHVSIVVYAGASGLVLENVPATNKARIEQALDKLRAGGSTAGAAGIRLAYETAQKHYIDGGVNRVILCTDGDFNVGISGTDALVDLIKQKANPEADEDGKRRGVYLSVLGYGMGNLNDAMMEPLTNAGNGNYAYIDTLKEATKVMYDQAGASLVTIAKDVKVQVHFDREQVMAYRLIGYENRVLANVDFDNDKVDAGDIGAGHSVTALYEVVPFPAEGEGLDGEGFFEVRHRIEELEQAVALNQSLMQTAMLSPKQSMKLAASTRMLEQEIMLAGAVAQKLSDKPAVNDQDAAPQVNDGAAAADDIAHEAASKETFDDGAMMAVKLRYKPVDAPAEDGTSRLITSRIFADETVPFAAADESTRFASSVAAMGMILRGSKHKGEATSHWVVETAQGAKANDAHGYREEFVRLATQVGLLEAERDNAFRKDLVE